MHYKKTQNSKLKCKTDYMTVNKLLPPIHASAKHSSYVHEISLIFTTNDYKTCLFSHVLLCGVH